MKTALESTRMVSGRSLLPQACAVNPQEPKSPVYEIEDQRAQGNGPDVGIRLQVTHQRHIHNSQQGNGDIADDVGDGKVQDFLVHRPDHGANIMHILFPEGSIGGRKIILT